MCCLVDVSIITLIMQCKFKDVNMINRRWRTRKTNRIAFCHYHHISRQHYFGASGGMMVTTKSIHTSQLSVTRTKHKEVFFSYMKIKGPLPSQISSNGRKFLPHNTSCFIVSFTWLFC